MSNVAFDLEVFNQVSAATPPPGGADGLLNAALGAIGPDLYQYVPISTGLSSKLNGLVKAAAAGLTPAQIQSQTLPAVDLTAIFSDPTLGPELFAKPVMAAYSILFSALVVPFWVIFQRDADLLNQLQTAADNQDSDALKDLAGQTSQLTGDSGALAKLVPALLATISAIQTLIATPTPIEATAATAKPWLPQSDRLFEFLRWHRTDVFAKNLVKLADTDAKKAYAYGHLCHVAAAVTGKPFVNNIVGGPYRSHWWRNRLVSNYVDAWTFGRYDTPASMSGDTPTPAYLQWHNINGANLQNKFNVAGLTAPAGQLPVAVNAVATGDLSAALAQFAPEFQALADYIQQAIDASYPTNFRPKGFTSDLVKDGFVGLFAVVWFMTSGFGPMTPLNLGSAPNTCTAAPGWVSAGGAPPSPQSSGPSTGATVCGVLLSILALLLFLVGGAAAGVVAVVGAIAEFASDGDIDWDQLACNLYWLRHGILQAQLAITDGLVRAGLAYPQPEKLGTQDANGVFRPAVDMSAGGGVPLTKSRAGSLAVANVALYPRQMFAAPPPANHADLGYNMAPTSPIETPPTTSLPLDPCYADKVLDNVGAPALQNGGMLASTGFPTDNRYFGDAVANAKLLIGDQASKLPPYNLDADRGYGWKCWSPAVNTFPGNGQVDNPRKET